MMNNIIHPQGVSDLFMNMENLDSSDIHSHLIQFHLCVILTPVNHKNLSIDTAILIVKFQSGIAKFLYNLILAARTVNFIEIRTDLFWDQKLRSNQKMDNPVIL